MVWSMTEAALQKAERARLADPERERAFDGAGQADGPARRSEHADVFAFVAAAERGRGTSVKIKSKIIDK